MFFAWAHVFFFPFHKPNYYECAFFLAKPTTHARVVRHTILKRNGKKKPWAQTNNSLPNNHVRHNEASFNSTKWRCPYDNVTYCKFTPNRKQLPKQLPPPLHMARTWMDMHRLRRLHDSQYIMKNPFTNENSNLSNIFHNNIHRKKVESLKVRSTEEFLCQFAWLPCRFFRGRRQGRQPLNNYIQIWGCMSCRFVQKVSNAVQCESKSSNLAVACSRKCIHLAQLASAFSLSSSGGGSPRIHPMIPSGKICSPYHDFGGSRFEKMRNWQWISSGSHFTLTLNQLCFESVFLVLWLYWSLVLSDSFNYSVHICFCSCCLICFLVRVCRLMFPQMVPSSSTFPAASWDTIDEDVPGICDSILHGAHSALLLEILTGHHRTTKQGNGQGPTGTVSNLPSSFHGGKICQDVVFESH